MKTFKVPFTRDDYGYILIRAENEQEAQELFETGEFSDNDMNIKGGNTIIDGEIIEIK